MELVRVAAIIVTRGDVEVERVTASLPAEWERLVWSNGTGGLLRWSNLSASVERIDVPDLAVYGRYAAIEHTDADLIYVQDDDCIVSDPQAIVEALVIQRVTHMVPGYGGGETIDSTEIRPGVVVCNMPQAFRHDFYTDHALVGFGACFHRDAPRRAFEKFRAEYPDFPNDTGKGCDRFMFQRTCDIVFTALTPRVLVDIPYENLPWADGPDRMWRQPTHVAERSVMRQIVGSIT